MSVGSPARPLGAAVFTMGHVVSHDRDQHRAVLTAAGALRGTYLFRDPLMRESDVSTPGFGRCLLRLIEGDRGAL